MPFEFGNNAQDSDQTEETVQSNQQDDQLKRELTGANSKLQRQQMMIELMKDPEIGEVLRARADGRKLKIIPLSQAGDENEDDGNDTGTIKVPGAAEPDFDTMSEKDKMGYLLGSFDKNFKASLPKILQQYIEPLTSRLKQLEGVAQNHEVEQARRQVETMRSKYPDFDDYQSQMLDFSEKNPNLNAEQLYVLAKTSTGKPIETNRNFSTERPVNTSAVPAKPRKDKIAPGILGLRQAIQGGVSRLQDRIAAGEYGDLG